MFSKPCGTVLLDKVKQTGNRFDFKPRKVYCYYGINAALCNFLKCSKFLRMYNLWKDRQSYGSVMNDIIDGKVWQEQMEMLKVNGRNSNVLGFLLINLDWFQPFKHISYPVGVIYAAILNLLHSV